MLCDLCGLDTEIPLNLALADQLLLSQPGRLDLQRPFDFGLLHLSSLVDLRGLDDQVLLDVAGLDEPLLVYARGLGG